MPEITCKNCGSLTNTAVSEHDCDMLPAKCCYLRWVNERWEKGCGYELGSKFRKDFADKILKEQDERKS